MYFNGIDATLFINETFIHDAVTFEYTESQQKMPVYGYKSVTWDDVLLGDILVQGGFTLNFQDRVSTDSQGNTIRYDLIDDIVKFQGANDVAFAPPVSGEAPISRNRVDINLVYASRGFKDKHGEASNISPLMQTQFREYAATEGLRSITIKDAVITAHTMSMQIDPNPIGIFYSFIAKRIIL